MGKPAYEPQTSHRNDPSQKDSGFEIYLGDDGTYFFDVHKKIRGQIKRKFGFNRWAVAEINRVTTIDFYKLQ